MQSVNGWSQETFKLVPLPVSTPQSLGLGDNIYYCNILSTVIIDISIVIWPEISRQ